MIFRILFIFLSLSLALPCQASFEIRTSLPLTSLESLPIQDQGRRKPFRIFAEEFLLTVSGTSSLTRNHAHFTALQIVTALWLSPQRLAPQGWERTPLILVKDKQLKQSCGLPTDQDLFSMETLRNTPCLQLQILEVRKAREQNPEAKLSKSAQAAEDVAARMLLLAALTEGSLVHIVPSADSASTSWSPPSPHDPHWKYLRATYASGNAAAFQSAVTDFRNSLTKNAPADYKSGMPKIQLELFYQALHPFRWAWILYLLAGFALLFLPSRTCYYIYPYAWLFTLLGFLFQIAGFICRIIIAGRPPVTNMYESILWVAFGTILFALIFEFHYRNRLFLAGAIPIATASLILADSQPIVLNPSIYPLTAVLQSNFWLTIHVLTITLSYAAFALAMGIAHIALGKIVLGRSPPPFLYHYLYRVLQVGVLFLACGTILGGVWANYSWGRFWNWDPKETWALITLLAYLIVLHGRIAGKWNGFGLAVGSVVGFLSVLMAWYGVNFVLSTGLHSYGFGTGGFLYAATAAGLDMLFVTLAVIRHQYKYPRVASQGLLTENPPQ